jgi:FkbM family methyltransferase
MSSDRDSWDIGFFLETVARLFLLLIVLFLQYRLQDRIKTFLTVAAPSQSGKLSFFAFAELNCNELRLPAPWLWVRHIVNQVKQRFGNVFSSTQFVLRWLARFNAWNATTPESTDSLRKQFMFGLQCNQLYNRVPLFLATSIADCAKNTMPKLRQKFRHVSLNAPEVFCFHHGLMRFPSSVIRRLKQRDILDLGAYDGASSLVFSEYCRAVYAFEISKDNIRLAESVLAQNPNFSWNVHLFPIGISDKSGTMACAGNGQGAHVTVSGKDLISMVSVDEFTAKHNLTVGFLKADLEGHGFAMVMGARQTLLRDRPAFSICLYHDFTEMFNLTEFLMDLLPRYHFELHLERSDLAYMFFHPSIAAWPLEAEE